jgi:GNAT superfamily N-acetyltransferase
MHDVLKGGHDVSDEPRDESGKWADGGGDGGDDGGDGSKFAQPSPAEFIAARNKSTRANFMSPLKPEDLSGHTLITTKDMKAGVAVDKQGDLQNLYNNGGPKGIGADLIAEAIHKGAKTLDCYDEFLPNYYAQMGFVETGRLHFDINFAHDWDVNKQGEPDVVFMAWKGYPNGDEKAAIARAKSSRENWIPHEQTTNYPADYDTAKEQSRVVAGRTKTYRYSGQGKRPTADGAGNQSFTASGERSRLFLKGGHDVSDEPRDESGKWTDGGGDGGGGDDKGEHPGKGYSASAYIDKHGVIQTNNVYDAQRALFEDRRVELQQVKQISTLIKRLGETAAEMAEHGATAPVFNLCNVSVKGTNLFCADQIGIPRVEMPVIRAGATKDFIKYLKKQGYGIEKGNERAANLRATQNEISGVKVAAAVQKIKDRGFYKRLVISKDDYILDGHHTWAAQLAIDAKAGTLKGDKSVKIARVDISITKLIAEAEKWTGGAGKKPASEAPKGYRHITLRQAQFELDPALYKKFADVAYKFLAANGHLARGFDDILITVPIKEWDESKHPREPGGSPEGGEFASGGGGAAGESTGTATKGKKTKVEKISDFDKKGVHLDHDTTINPAKAEKFLARWNERVQEAPEDFKKDFIGVPGTMRIEYNDASDKLYVSGNVQEDGKNVGEYQRYIDLKNNSAYSAYFVLKKGERGAGIGKKLLAANVAMYQKMGIDMVKVSANIDVGGYAWAKYGYVPTPESWRNLSSDIRDKLNRESGRTGRAPSGSGYTPEDWDSIKADDQDNIEQAWMSATESEFRESEIQNWRDSGQALENAKRELASSADPRSDKWAVAALTTWRNGLSDKEAEGISYTNEQILDATIVDNYESRGGEGRDDPEISIDLDKLKDSAQPTLPGIPDAPPLTDETYNNIVAALTESFNDQAGENAQDMDPPDFDVSDYQSEYWSTMSDRDKFQWADRNGELPEYDVPDEDEDEEEPEPEPVEASDPQRDALMKLAQSSDPKALWAIADSSQGKNLLLHSAWSGVLNLKDKQTMDRFHAYVGKAK